MKSLRNSYRLSLPAELEYVHNVFHISQLWKYVPDPNYVIEPEPIALAEDLTYEEHPIQILDRWVKQLRNKSIPLVKVLWAGHDSFEATWETEEDIRNKYPSLLVQVKPYNFENETYFKGGKAVMACPNQLIYLS